MKRLLDLRPADLERVAVWLYRGETDDVALLRATNRQELTSAEPQVFVARTQFTLANGAHHIGFCSPCRDPRVEVLQPVIVTADGLVFFHFDEPPSRETLDRQWRRLGAPGDEVFPIHYRCTIPIDGVFITGTIEWGDLTGAA